MTIQKKIYLFPLWARIWHGVNAVGILVLIATGISMQYSTASFILIDFKTSIKLHNIAGIVVAVFYLMFIIGNIVTPNGSFYHLKISGAGKRMLKQVKYYLCCFFKIETPPYPISEKHKFNPLQKYAYIGVMYVIVPFVIISGIALLFPEFIIEEIFNVSGIMLTAVLHGIAGFLILIFLIVHIYVAAIGESPTKNFKSMITGWH
ncbi:thiosulfate reductase cytochrome b subunit [Saccharicrinis carchari]|uniref:Thiosulfate reductase cytochrome b subunit n=1 Tax=Saccharicrinis carchari TaxID=1168039 RepID=A0A521B8L9_SACCC|nr:cytochrome b/b6 domain-containing protein [Saccharicrinis carchari]SMO43426.1 thiosulfate reductase cytochrome b subunit [Saccharicrinis carchari]